MQRKKVYNFQTNLQTAPEGSVNIFAACTAMINNMPHSSRHVIDPFRNEAIILSPGNKRAGGQANTQHLRKDKCSFPSLRSMGPHGPTTSFVCSREQRPAKVNQDYGNC